MLLIDWLRKQYITGWLARTSLAPSFLGYPYMLHSIFFVVSRSIQFQWKLVFLCELKKLGWLNGVDSYWLSHFRMADEDAYNDYFLDYKASKSSFSVFCLCFREILLIILCHCECPITIHCLALIAVVWHRVYDAVMNDVCLLVTGLFCNRAVSRVWAKLFWISRFSRNFPSVADSLMGLSLSLHLRFLSAFFSWNSLIFLEIAEIYCIANTAFFFFFLFFFLVNFSAFPAVPHFIR